MQHYLSLFSGGGLGDLAHQRLLSMRCVGYVEFNSDAQSILRARIRDKSLQAAPIYGDVRDFANKGAHQYQGLVDVVTAGFPCQPFSSAGKGLGELDPKNMWPATREVLRIVRPRHAHLENVAALLGPLRRKGQPAAPAYFGTVLRDLAELGFNARWGVLSAKDAGALHLRKRVWVVANAIGAR